MGTSGKMWFVEDLVALKDDPTWVGVVKRSWEDVDNYGWIPSGAYTLFHKNVPMSVRDEFAKSGKPSRGYVVVLFNHRLQQSCLIHESRLILLERSLSFGDVVKRRAGDSLSGTVIHTYVECTLQSPIPSETVGNVPNDKGPQNCFRFPFSDAAVDANRFSDREYIRGVPAEELKPAEAFTEERFVVYRDWVGVIEEVSEEVTVRLSNGSVVEVEDPMELRISIDPAEIRKHFSQRTTNGLSGGSGRPTRKSKGKSNSSSIADNKRPLKSVFPDRLVPGQFVISPRENIRRGTWKKGAFDADVAPNGYVVEVVTTGLGIRWLFQNIFNPRGPVHQPAPPNYLESHELKPGKFHVYDRERRPRHSSGPNGIVPGYGHGTNLQPGDFVRFKDLTKASIKYNSQTHGKLTVIPSLKSEGYDVNTFKVIETRTKVTVQWQDLSVTTQDSTDLIPYLNVDDLEVWPGEYVAVKVPKASKEDLMKDPDRRKPPAGSNYTQEEWNKLRRKSIGVAQSVDAGERIARVRWFLSTNEFPPGSEETTQVTVIPGAYLAKEEECSIYELTGVPRLSMRRGDFVSIESGLATGISKKKAKAPIDWFGEIVDLRLDGLVTIRLGALEKVQDVNVPAQRVLVVYGADDDQLEDSEDEYESEGSDWRYIDDGDTTDGTRTPDVIEEIVEYEGGERLDPDGGDDAWSTADDENSAMEEDEHNEGSEDIEADEEYADVQEEPGKKFSKPPDNGESTQVNEPALDNKRPMRKEMMTSPYTEAPRNIPKFAVLEESPPADHAFLNDPQSLSLALTKKIWKEYKILETSLPDWVFVRTWETRIDLLRTLIIGPQHTPYALAPFVIDLYFPPTFPTDPPRASFHSWTGGVGKINPNLYEDGMICLSILGTWPGNGNVEGWSPARSSVLQILVSILGLVLVKEPYYNEAGYEILVGSEDSHPGSIQYNERAYILSKNFVKHALQNLIGGFEDEIKALYLPGPKANTTTNNREGQDGEQDINHPNLLRCIIEHVRLVVQRSEKKETQGLATSSWATRSRMAADFLEAEGVSRVSRGALSLLRRNLGALEEILAAAEAETGRK